MDWTLKSTSEVIPNFNRYLALSKNWKFSRKMLAKVIRELDKQKSELGEKTTIGVAGSLGRLEASGQSDLDCIVIAEDATSAEKAKDAIEKIAKEFKLALPKPGGVFSKPSTIDELTKDIGAFTDDLGALGRRMLLLLECRPLYNEPLFTQHVNAVYGKYSEYLRDDGRKQFAFLTNDLIRYFRSICVNYQDTFWRENEKWPIRNIKLRHSRILMYAGLLFTLGSVSKEGSRKIEIVRDRLPLTPLERIAVAYEEAGDDCFFRIAGCYDIFLSRLSDRSHREKLAKLEYNRRYESPLFSELKSNSDSLISELLRFAMSRRGHWSDRFYEYLIF